jgi:DNA polymerase-3 subunit gamma/tau
MDEAPFEGEAPALRVTEPVPGGEPRETVTAAEAPPAPASPKVQRTALGDRWAGIVTALLGANAITALARELAMQSELIGIEADEGGGERWTLKVERETLRAPTLSEKLQAALVAHSGSKIRLEVTAGVPGDSPARRDAEAVALRQREAEDIIHNDPLVQAMLAQFSTARIVPGSIRPA